MAKASGERGRRLRTVISMKANTSLIRSMALAHLLGSRAIITEEVTKMTRGTGMEKCTGLMAVVTKGSGLVGYKMG
jgi:hypothetical protein